MVQKTSPFIESKYGWNLGESGWNTGADENFLKFAFMLDNGVDDIVSSLPQNPLNGKAYYLTTDNRFYFVVDGTYYSSPCPKWFTFKLKTSGQRRIYDGSSVVSLPSDIDVSSILTDIGSSSNSFKTSLANKTDISQGSNLVGYILDASSVGRTVSDKLRDFVSIKDFGAVEGQDIGVFIQKAHDQGYSRVYVNEGKYKWTTAVTVTHYMEIYGSGYAESPNADRGTWFELNKTGFTPLTFSGPNARGSIVGHCAFWETNHPSEVSGWVPANNDYVIKVLDCYGRVVFDDVYMLRVNKGVYCFNSGRMHFKKITGQWYTNAIQIDRCLDVPAIDYIHHWTFYTSSNVVLAYEQANLDLIQLNRCDGGFLGNIFGFAARSIVRFSGTSEGIASKIYINSLCSDFTLKTLWFDNTASNSNVLIANMTTQGEAWPSTGTGLSGGSAIAIDASSCTAQIGNLHTQRYLDNTIRIGGSNNRVEIFDAWFELSNQSNSAAPIVAQNDGTSVVYFGGPVRIDNSNSAPLFGSGITGLSSAISNRTAASTDEPRLFWGTGGAGIAVNSPNAASDMYVSAKGQNGSVRLTANGKTIMRFDDGNGTAACDILVRANNNNIQFFAEGSAANVDYSFSPKGAGVSSFNTPVRFPAYTFSQLTTALAATYSGSTVRITDRNQRLATSDGTNWRFTDGTVIA